MSQWRHKSRAHFVQPIGFHPTLLFEGTPLSFGFGALIRLQYGQLPLTDNERNVCALLTQNS